MQRSQLRYDALYPDPLKVSLEAVIERWKISKATSQEPPPIPNLEQLDAICKDAEAGDKVANSLMRYSSSRLFTDCSMTMLQ